MQIHCIDFVGKEKVAYLIRLDSYMADREVILHYDSIPANLTNLNCYR